MIDFDTVSLHNIHRQIAFTLADEEKLKAEVVVDLMKSKNPFLKAHAHTMPFIEFTKQNQMYDLILDATDSFVG